VSVNGLKGQITARKTRQQTRCQEAQALSRRWERKKNFKQTGRKGRLRHKSPRENHLSNGKQSSRRAHILRKKTYARFVKGKKLGSTKKKGHQKKITDLKWREKNHKQNVIPSHKKNGERARKKPGPRGANARAEGNLYRTEIQGQGSTKKPNTRANSTNRKRPSPNTPLHEQNPGGIISEPR